MAAAFPHKKRSTKYPGITLQEDGRWLVVKTWIDTGTGKRSYRRKLVKGSIEDAQKARAELRGQEQNSTEQSRPRFGAFAQDWLVRHRARRKLHLSTAQRYTTDVAHLVVAFRDWWVDAMTYAELEKWQADRAPKYASATVNGWLRTLRLILDAAQRFGIIKTNPARQLSTLPEGRTKGARGTALSANELRAFVQAIPVAVEKKLITSDTGRAVTVLAMTGMRLGEVVAMRWDDIADGELHVDRSVWRTHEKTTKTDDPRRVTLAAPLVETLEQQRRWLLTSQHPGLESGLVFPSSPTQARAGGARRGAEGPSWFRSQSTLQNAVGAVCALARCPRVTPHSLRRTFEDLLREAGVEQMVRRAVAGWRSERAQGIYATVSREDRDAAAESFIKLVLG